MYLFELISLYEKINFIFKYYSFKLIIIIINFNKNILILNKSKN